MSETDDVQGGESTRAQQEEDAQLAEWEKIVSMFTYHKPDEDQVGRMELLRIHARVLMREIMSSCPPSPDRQCAVQHLREAIMWANASIVLEGQDDG